MDIDIVSLFPEYFLGPFDESILKRARQKGILSINHVNLRDFAEDKHQRVDDRPFGGGPGMVLMAPPLKKAIESVKKPLSTVIYLSPKGALLTAEMCQKLAKKKHLVLLCGHYEGIDERIMQEVDEEISIGDYVLTNGALAAIVLVDALARFIPGVLGNEHASTEDSFQEGILDWPHYTRPEEFEGRRVPRVLLEGDHKKIALWRRNEALNKTRLERKDLYYSYLAKHGAIETKVQGSEEKIIEAESLEIFLPVEEIEKSAQFYSKLLGFEIAFQNAYRALLKMGTNNVTLIKGESTGEIVLKLVIRNGFEQLAARLLRASKTIKKLQIKAGEMTFLDPNGYSWILLEPSSLKGE